MKAVKNKIPSVDKLLSLTLGGTGEVLQGGLEGMKKTEKMKSAKKKIPSANKLLSGTLEETGAVLQGGLVGIKEAAMATLPNVDITKLTSPSALVIEIGEICEEAAMTSLEDVTSNLGRSKTVKVKSPENTMMIYKAMVTLDPDTAHPRLLLSEEGRHVRWPDTGEPLPDIPERFTYWPCVLGSEGFTSGKHYWEVQLQQKKRGWCVGVATESVGRNEWIPWSPKWGVWAVEAWKGQYWALTSPLTPLSPNKNPKKLGVFLDYELGRVSVYNADSLELLHTFPQACFTEKLFPLFSLWRTAELALV